jgi:cell wall-associated NlpC family hydrolase
MSVRPAEKNGDIPRCATSATSPGSSGCKRGRTSLRHVPVCLETRNVPVFFLLAALLAGCGSAPEPQPVPRQWDGSGGAAELRNRGEALANFALSLRGTRYRYGGATREGFDCSGLVFYAHRHFGLTVPRTSSDQAEEAESIKPRKLKRGDLVFFRIDSRRINHVGIYIGKKRFVHAPGAGKPVTINSLDEEFYAETFESAGRYWDQLPH